ncbi:MAG: hypothetical protein QXR16_02230 [Candidatus Micrarchaeaceae archaeon]
MEKEAIKKLARNTEITKDSLNEVLENASKKAAKYQRSEGLKSESDMRSILRELENSKEKFGIEPERYVLPTDIEELSRILESNLLEDVQSLMAKGNNYNLESALYICIGEAMAGKIKNRAGTFTSDGYVSSFDELVAGINLSVEIAEKENQVSAKLWLQMGIYYATFLNMLMLINVVQPETTKAFTEKADKLLDYSLKELLDMNFELDDKSLIDVWNAISKKYEFEKYYPKLQSLEAISRSTSLNLFISESAGLNLFDDIEKTYYEMRVDGTLSLEVFLMTKVAGAIIGKAIEFGNIMNASDAGENEVSLPAVKALYSAITKAKEKNAFGKELLQPMDEILKLLVSDQQPRTSKESTSYIS